MNETKIQFSSSETEMMCSAGIILTKNRILEKVRLLLEVIQEELAQIQLQHGRSGEIFNQPAKISKGENYAGLPYLILDYPRFFKPGNIFAIRTMFWWGNFFSTTLHLDGLYRSKYAPILGANTDLLAQNNFYIGINSNPWAHHFEESNYRKIGPGKEVSDLAPRETHLKLATKLTLEEWPLAEDTLVRNWKLLMTICGLVATDPVK